MLTVSDSSARHSAHLGKRLLGYFLKQENGHYSSRAAEKNFCGPGADTPAPSKPTSSRQSDASHEFSKALIGAEAVHTRARLPHRSPRLSRPGISRT